MTDRINNQAWLTYRCGTQVGKVASNIASTALQGPFVLGKIAHGDTYRYGQELFYMVTFDGSFSGLLSDVTLEDDLGTFSLPGGVSVTPLDFIGPAWYYINGYSWDDLTPVARENGIVFTIPYIPEKSSVQILYRARVNDKAPLEPGSTITNNIVATVAGAEPEMASSTLTAEEYADVRIIKTMSPDPVTSGKTLTYTFAVYNYGNAEATDIMLSDVFDPAPVTATVTVNGIPVGCGKFDFASGAFTLPKETCAPYSIPAATFLQNPETGHVTVNPGTMIVTVSGLI